MDSYSFTWITVYHCHSLLWGQILPDVNQWNPFILVPFKYLAIFFWNNFLLSDTTKCSSLTLYFFVCTNSGSTHFLNETQLIVMITCCRVNRRLKAKARSCNSERQHSVWWTRKTYCFWVETARKLARLCWVKEKIYL